MKILGLEITTRKEMKDRINSAREKALSSVDGRDGGWYTVFESYSGAWQADVDVDHYQVMSHHAVFSCISLIANDVGKLRAKLMAKRKDGIWEETTSPVYSPVLKKPNRYQNAIQFRESWMASKLSRGNTYCLKQRDSMGSVTGLYILDPQRVTPLVADDGSVFYQCAQDTLSNLETSVIVPAREIIHDRINCMFHPLVGLSPTYACGVAATMGLAGTKNGARLFTNMSRPSGILTAPGNISNDTATRLKSNWEDNYTGENFGKTAVLGDGLKYDRISMTSEEAQMLELLKWDDEVICSAYHVPPFKVQIGQMPTYQNAEVLNQIYYSDCLQSHIEQYEACMNEGLGLDTPVNGRQMGVELDIDGLLRMDTATQMKTLGEGVKGTVITPNEARLKVNKKPLEGGDTVYMQQQNYSLEALAERDRDKPFSKPTEPAAPEPQETDDNDSTPEDQIDKALTLLWKKSPEEYANVS